MSSPMMNRMFGGRCPAPAAGTGAAGRCCAWASGMPPVAAVAIRALPPSRRSRRELLLVILWSPPVGGSGHSRFPADAAEADMAHAAVHHLRVAGCRAVAPAVGRRAEEGAALHHLPRNANRWLSGIEGCLHRGTARIRRGATARLGRIGVRMARGPPVRGPLPDVPAHLEQAIAVRREAPDPAGAGKAIRGEVPPWEGTLPGVGAVHAAGRQLVPPGELRALEAAAGGKLPLRFRRHLLADPTGVGLGVLEGDLDHGVIFTTEDC